MYTKTLIAAMAGSALAQSTGGYMCPLSPPAPMQDNALSFAYNVQVFLNKFYSAQGDLSADSFSSIANASTVESNGQTLAMNRAANFAGLAKQAQIGVQAIEQLAEGANMPLAMDCDFSYPPGMESSAMDFITSSYFIEATLCGTFIGLGSYVQAPQAAFLMARMSAEHGIHASAIGSSLNPVTFSADSSSLTPAFTPEYVLDPGSGDASMMNIGHLGQYIPMSCAPAPPAPCGVDVEITDTNVMLSGGNDGGAVPTNSYVYGAPPLPSQTVAVSTSVAASEINLSSFAPDSSYLTGYTSGYVSSVPTVAPVPGLPAYNATAASSGVASSGIVTASGYVPPQQTGNDAASMTKSAGMVLGAAVAVAMVIC